jgi:hypothetical protein
MELKKLAEAAVTEKEAALNGTVRDKTPEEQNAHERMTELLRRARGQRDPQ